VAKKKKDFTGDPGGLIGDAMFSVIKPIYKEGEKAKRNARRAARRAYYYEPEPTWSQKEIVFDILEQAMANAGLSFSARDLYYATRPLCYADLRWPEGKDLKYGYFSQTLLTEYQERHGSIPGLWRDPRGNLHEPHTGKTVPLGTREVASYRFPEFVFDKILYVEKEGEMPKLEAAKLAERYDMAIVTGKGYPAEAVRTLFEAAEGGDYQLFVFHDADIDGYNIARVMREETRRMPDYNVDVVDIGLTVKDAVEMDLASEPYCRTGGVPATLGWRLTSLEREYFSGRRGERFELNAILPDTRRIEYIEGKLKENGVRGKVIPPQDKLEELAENTYRTKHAEWIDELLEKAGIKEKVADKFLEKFNLEDTRKYIEDGFKEDDALSWRTALENRLAALQEEHQDALRDAVREAVIEALKDGQP
jgi:hypothetical protein